MSQPLIDLVNISKSFDGELILDDLNLSVKENSFVTLLGPSGCGKSTTLRIIGGFAMPDQGKVIFNGEDITRMPPNKRQLNTVFQKYALFTHMTIAENIAFGLKIKGKSKDYINDKIKYALKLVNLDGYENRSVELLSGGQQQRIAIARAIVNEPKLLLLDEPAAGMNPQETDELTAFIHRIRDEFNLTIFMIEHHMNLVMEISDRIYVIDFGKQIANGIPSEIQSNQRVIEAYLGVSDDE